MASAAPGEIFSENPYEGHPSLSELESQVLWEYAKLAQHIKQVRCPALKFGDNLTRPELLGYDTLPRAR